MLFPTLFFSVSSLLIIIVDLAGDFQWKCHYITWKRSFHVRTAKSSSLWWYQLTVNVSLGDESIIFIETASLSFPLYSSGRNCRNPPLPLHGTLKRTSPYALIIDDPFTNIVFGLCLQLLHSTISTHFVQKQKKRRRELVIEARRKGRHTALQRRSCAEWVKAAPFHRPLSGSFVEFDPLSMPGLEHPPSSDAGLSNH